mmetsp:Transcript_91799/g.259608  ORF Transcript_91799/g.259608 Transcript_91799/m.259608 type:complete len:575 (+) Transcript_91799:104-1828(+)
MPQITWITLGLSSALPVICSSLQLERLNYSLDDLDSLELEEEEVSDIELGRYELESYLTYNLDEERVSMKGIGIDVPYLGWLWKFYKVDGCQTHLPATWDESNLVCEFISVRLGFLSDLQGCGLAGFKYGDMRNHAAKATTTMEVTAAGEHTFSMQIKDGGKLLVDGVELINMDGLYYGQLDCRACRNGQDVRCAEANIYLGVGNHSLEWQTFAMFGRRRRAYMTLTLEGPETAFRRRVTRGLSNQLFNGNSYDGQDPSSLHEFKKSLPYRLYHGAVDDTSCLRLCNQIHGCGAGWSLENCAGRGPYADFNPITKGGDGSGGWTVVQADICTDDDPGCDAVDLPTTLTTGSILFTTTTTTGVGGGGNDLADPVTTTTTIIGTGATITTTTIGGVGSGLTTSSGASATTTTTLTPNPVVAAVGDPHLQNIYGQQFDLMKPGHHVLISIPRGVRVENALLRVDAEARRLGGSCADVYFQDLNVTGAWIEAKHTGGLRFQAEDLGDRDLNWEQFGKVELKVAHGCTQQGTRYLNLYVKHLTRAEFVVGGLLGEDDHEEAATPSVSCVHRLSLVQAAS